LARKTNLKFSWNFVAEICEHTATWGSGVLRHNNNVL